eukprot:gene23716-biopygen8799
MPIPAASISARFRPDSRCFAEAATFERLEFLGDRVLALEITCLVLKRLGTPYSFHEIVSSSEIDSWGEQVLGFATQTCAHPVAHRHHRQLRLFSTFT